MKIEQKGAVLAPFIFLVTLAPLVGCSRTTTTETRVVDADVDPDYEARAQYRTTTTTTDVDEVDDCEGVLSCTVDAIGTVIALPFRAVGALVGAIF